MTDTDLVRRAKAIVSDGIRFLDTCKAANKRRPWREKVDGDKLEQSSGLTCVLAQIFGTYWEAADVLGFTYKYNVDGEEKTAPDPVRLGKYGFALGKEFMTWEALNAAWKEALCAPNKLQAAASGIATH